MGMSTPSETAEYEGTELAHRLERPVYLIHNPTVREPPHWTGTFNMLDDLSEAVYDRFWPETLGAAFKFTAIIPLPTAGFDFMQGLPFTQLNTTTRQITHLLYHVLGGGYRLPFAGVFTGAQRQPNGGAVPRGTLDKREATLGCDRAPTV